MELLTVSGLNLYVKNLLEADVHLRSFYLRGEISNLTDHYRSGHIYLTLKDEKAAVKAVMFAGSARYLKFRPQDGMKVIVRGRVSLYEVTGSYQLYIEDMQPDGVGALNLAFEQLKRKLAAEGLFDASRKRPLPAFPKRIGVITSPTGAAVQDICRVLGRRYPVGELILCPVTVQGEKAAAELTEAVRRMNRVRCADVIIIGRGGGSLEDLWPFNDEGLARAVAASEIPVISAVGHETDFTICDFVADVRASTPSAGAELAAPEMSTMLSALQYERRRMIELMQERLQQEARRLAQLRHARVLRSPMEMIHLRRMRLDTLYSGMKSAYVSALAQQKHRFASSAAKLDALSPLKVLSRGYAIVRAEDGVVSSVKRVRPQQSVQVTLRDGELSCLVCETKEDTHEKETGL